MAHVTPQFNVKTGSDSQLFFSREVTGNVPNKGKILDNVIDSGNVFEYPQLTRRTGHSIKGTTETIESSELRKGRTKSAPRKGNSSSEGSLDIELSPETYDDIFEAALRGKWELFNSDNDDKFVNPDGITCADGEFVSNGRVEDGGYRAVKLIGTDDNCIIKVDNPALYKIDQLKVGTEDIKFSALAQYGGTTGEDLYQEFQHLAVNTMDLSVSPGQIVTGSFGFMGSNNPRLLQTGDACVVADPQPTSATFGAGIYYTKTGDTFARATVFDQDTADADGYYVEPSGIIKELTGDDPMGVAENARFNKTRTAADVKAWIEDLANKFATTTDQFTAREGFLYVNGRRVQFGSNLTLNLNNGLKQLFAIFERDAISTAPMSLDITGTLDAYLITNYAEFLYNYGIDDKDVELVFCFQDQEDDPNYMYVIQIFKAKFDTDISQGAEELTISLPFTSFGERAMRMFRINKQNIEIDATDESVEISIASKPLAIEAGDLMVTAKNAVTGEAIELTPDGDYSAGVQNYTFTKVDAGTKVIFSAKYKDVYAKKGFEF